RGRSPDHLVRSRGSDRGRPGRPARESLHRHRRCADPQRSRCAAIDRDAFLVLLRQYVRGTLMCYGFILLLKEPPALGEGSSPDPISHRRLFTASAGWPAYSLTLPKGTSSSCSSGSSFVLDCANDRREYGAASTSGDYL